MNEALKPDDVTQRSTPAPIEPAPVETRPPRRRRLFVWIAVVAALAAAAAFAWRKFEPIAPSTNREESSGRPAQPPQTVRVAPVVLGDMPLTIDALGTVTPFETVTIRTQIAGTLQNVGFTEGQTVKAGDFIAQIDPRPYEAALAQAQGQLAKDQALLGQAQSDLARYQQLAKQDSIAQQQVADQIALVAQDKAAIAADQAMVKTAELNVAYTHIISPVTGTGGPEARRSWQLSAALRRHRHRRHHANRSDQRRVHDAREQFAAHRGAAQFRRQASGSRCSTGTMSMRSRPER